MFIDYGRLDNLNTEQDPPSYYIKLCPFDDGWYSTYIFLFFITFDQNLKQTVPWHWQLNRTEADNNYLEDDDDD